MEILAKAERIICPVLDQEGVMSPRGVLFLAKCTRLLDGIVLEKVNHHKSSMLVLVMAKDSFLRVRKKISQL